MTKAREYILSLLRASEIPLSAQDISERKEMPMNSVTIYRTLHYLEERGLCESFPLTCTEKGTERYYAVIHHEEDGTCIHHHWFHCEECHSFIDLGSCRINSLIDQYEKDFSVSVSHHSLSLTGTCSRCR